MTILEFDKRRLAEKYNGDVSAMYADSDYYLWNEETIAACFNAGYGTMVDFQRYVDLGKDSSVFFH